MVACMQALMNVHNSKLIKVLLHNTWETTVAAYFNLPISTGGQETLTCEFSKLLKSEKSLIAEGVLCRVFNIVCKLITPAGS